MSTSTPEPAHMSEPLEPSLGESSEVSLERAKTARFAKQSRPASKDPSVVRGYTDNSYHNNAKKVAVTKPLTTKQKLFVKYWAEGDTILSATKRAGYNDGGTFGYRLARMPNILKLYEIEKRKYEEASHMTRKRVMDGLLESVEIAKTMSEPSTMVAGWREIAKMCGYYEPIQKKINLNISGELVHKRMAQLSDAELVKLIEEGAKDAPSSDEDDDDSNENPNIEDVEFTLNEEDDG